MKILVYGHKLVMGGTAVNAIELAAELRDRFGHNIVFFAAPGPLIELVKAKGLRYVPAPDTRFHPTPALMSALRAAVRREKPELIHTWDWWQCLDAYFGVHLTMQVPMLATDMTMNVTRVLPKRLLTTFGTPELVVRAKALHWQRVELLLPPVDVGLNSPNAMSGAAFRDAHGIGSEEFLLVTVSRLAESLKSESLLRTLDVIRALDRTLPVRFVIVGDGSLRAKLERLASEINTEVGRNVVLLTGQLLDPRPAYAAADIVIGMGSSALRGMAFAKPVVIVGKRGFASPFTPESATTFHYTGMYGEGNGRPGNEDLLTSIQMLAEDRQNLSTVGEFSRNFVVKNYSLEAIASQLTQYCQLAVATDPRLPIVAADALRTAAVYIRERRFMTPSND